MEDQNDKSFFISDDKSRIDFEFVYAYLSQESYWAKNIPKDVLKRAIANSHCFGVYRHNGEQVGFARVITDYATFGYLADVFISESCRGEGLSKMLIKHILAQPQLQGLRRFGLFTKDAHGLYRQFGFTEGKTPQNYMEIKLDNPYGPQ